MTIEKKRQVTKLFKKNKRNWSLYKAPQAPKRFRLGFILFYSHVQAKIEAELRDKAKVRLLYDSF